MQKTIVKLDGSIETIDLTPEEIAEIQLRPTPIVAARSAPKRLLRLALLQLGYLSSFNEALAAADVALPMQGVLNQWEDTAIVHEDNPLVQFIIQSLGWTPAIVDSIFDLIATLN